jgi:hypothetical protein
MTSDGQAVREEQRAQTRLALGAMLIPIFGGLGVGTDMLRLLAWTGVIVALLLLPVSRKLARQRERSVDAVPAVAAGAGA